MTKGLQSAACTSCPLTADKTHTCSLSCIFCQVQEVNCPEGARETTLGCAPTENDQNPFAACGRQTLRGFFDTLMSPFSIPKRGTLLFKLGRFSKRRLRQHRAIRQEVSDRIFAPIQSLENEGILYVFETVKKGLCPFFDKRIAVCCAHVLSAYSGQDAHLQPELYFLSGTRPDRK